MLCWRCFARLEGTGVCTKAASAVPVAVMPRAATSRKLRRGDEDTATGGGGGGFAFKARFSTGWLMIDAISRPAQSSVLWVREEGCYRPQRCVS